MPASNTGFRAALPVLLSAAFVLTLSNLARAQDDGIAGPIDVRGTWTMTHGSIGFRGGRVLSFPDDYAGAKITVTSQDGPVVFAEGSAQVRSRPGGAERVDQERFVGALMFDNSEMILTPIGGSIVWRCKFLDEKTMDCINWQSGTNAVAGTGRFQLKE